MSWEEAWSEGRTGWDAGASPPILRELIEADVLPKGRAFVPGCGAGYDVLTLAEAGHEVVGLDVAPTAAVRFEALRAESGLTATQARVVVGDFFTFDAGAPFDLFWDYTFLCALSPDIRADWERRVFELVQPEGELVTLIFPARPEPMIAAGRPPFPLLPDDVEALLAPRWDKIELRRVERSHPGREGLEWIARWRKR